jgi:hypothetical protein
MLCLALLLGAALGAVPRTSTHGQVVTPLAAACAAGALGARASWQGATGALRGTVVVTNRGTASCSLLSGPGIQPRVQVLDAKGRLLAVRMAPQGIHSMLLRLVVIRPGGHVQANVRWSNWCQAYHGVVKLRIAVPGTRGTVVAPVLDARGKPLGGTPRCDDRAAPSTIQLGPFA